MQKPDPTELPEPKLDPDSPMGKLAAHMENLQDARNVADAAPAVEAVDPTTGETVKSVRVRLGPEDTRRIMAAPPEVRQAMAESVLAERQEKNKANAVARVKLKKVRADRKRKAKERKKSRGRR